MAIGRVLECGIDESACPAWVAEGAASREDIEAGLLEGCAGSPALAVLVNNSQQDCAGLMATLGGANASLQASCFGATEDTLYARLGEEAGITAAITAFVGRVVVDPKINSYFLNTAVDGGRLIDCLVLQVASVAGGPQMYPGTSDCRDMVSSHVGLGISDSDFNDLVGHLVDVLTEGGVSGDDIGTIGAVLGTTYDAIVESPNDNETIYHRLGRYPGIDGAVGLFIGAVVADDRINGFFGATDAARLQTCLNRQVCGATGGPCVYGAEVDGVPGLTAATPCLDMATVHAGMMDDMGSPVTIDDFDALVEDLVGVLMAANVDGADITAIGGALAPTCPAIVANAADCPQ
jgi:hemoglobin